MTIKAKANASTTSRGSTSGKTAAAAMISLVLLASGLSGCGGNYSNEDLDFQLALPEGSDLTVKLPQALLVAGAAEYYLTTRKTVAQVNAVVIAVTGLVDHIRSFPPSQRQGDVRIWGPFPHQRDPRFELRQTMVRSGGGAEGLSFDYQIEFHSVGVGAAAWLPIITGNFVPSGGARLGRGRITVDLTEARVQGYPVDDFELLERMQIDYQRRAPPFMTTMTTRNLPGAVTPAASVSYSENADGSGEMTFTAQVRDNIYVEAIELHTGWIASGAGRGDARAVEGVAAIAGGRGIDCWAADTRATYVRRDWERREEGDPASCVLGPPTP